MANGSMAPGAGFGTSTAAAIEDEAGLLPRLTGR
ncbi:hypothetical protein SAMN05444161_6114 [Rhizobiales bacterium GAS191]|nr:hypothetical protein SAMN05519104_4916 [Rhizobiales bacterium GAS188]SEE54430.1 hypothetical protein SAMN05444161_6114 [Rhizobiales bacterium GAS191]